MSQPLWRRLHVLVVEDNAINQQLIVSTPEKLGHTTSRPRAAIIALTAYARQADRERGLAAGIDD